MLKNKEERKAFILNKDNWTQSFDLSVVFITVLLQEQNASQKEKYLA